MSTDGSRRSFLIQAPGRDRSSAGAIYQSAITELRGDFAGEQCRWWSVYHGLSGGEPSFRHQSCVTGDGIEIGSRTIGSNGEIWSFSLASATSIIRKPISASIVKPPEIPVNGWLDQFFGQFDRSSARNFSVLLSGHASEMIVRRRGAWTGELTRRPDGSLTAHASKPGGYVSARIAAGGKAESLTYDRRPTRAAPPEIAVNEPAETILGILCRWVGVMPDVMDAGRHECRSENGIPLKVRLFSRGTRSDFVAVQIDRSAGSIEDLLPPPELLDPKTWGVR
ncbi:hypothetical protein ACIQC9_13380 [Brevundimonas sp. NPDC092305]|uniref:hypothetical protein n=1 Tax=Brevundimonas sp. NPDC092305 TaxID=3363957 RepID=UPI00380AF26F